MRDDEDARESGARQIEPGCLAHIVSAKLVLVALLGGGGVEGAAVGNEGLGDGVRRRGWGGRRRGREGRACDRDRRRAVRRLVGLDYGLVELLLGRRVRLLVRVSALVGGLEPRKGLRLDPLLGAGVELGQLDEAPDEELVREAAADNAARALVLSLAARSTGVVGLLLLLARELVWVLFVPDRAEQALLTAPRASLRPSWVPAILGVEGLNLAPLAPEVDAVETRDRNDEGAKLHQALVLLVDLVGKAGRELLRVGSRISAMAGSSKILLPSLMGNFLCRRREATTSFVRACRDEEDEGKAAPPLN